MCEWGQTIPMEVTVPAELTCTGEARQKTANIDSCIAPLIQALNKGGIATVACCCGHGKQPGRITLADGREMFLYSRADVATAQAALPDPAKLRVLADWFDGEDATGRWPDGDTSVQDDLRRWANDIEQAKV